MKRSKRQKVKQENQEPVASSHGENEEHDLAYFIHDRVELMHQVFSILKPKEILAMAPRCVRGVSIQDLQELCTDELLGISSKRLCAVLDGAEPPSDTESSSASPEQMETISLDSISSDEEILSQSSSRKSKKHKHRRHSKKKEKDKSRENHKSKERDRAKSPSQTTKEARAGLTVLELLELQARARAIRAQLTKDKSLNKQVQSEIPQSSVDSSSSGSEIEIKEEPALVVEISSEDEKPGPEQLREYLDNMPASTGNCTVTRLEPSSSKQNETNNSTTKRVNDLIITVPRAKSNRKIKLNRHRISETNNIKDNSEPEKDSNVPQKSNIEQKSATETVQTISVEKTSNSSNKKDKKRKDKKKTKKRKDNSEKEGSDHDEITLQLSDSEKMDLLEDLGGNKGKDSSSSKDSESSSEDSDFSSDDESSKQKKQDEPSKSDAEIVSTDNEKVSVKLNDQDKCTEEIPKASNQSEVNNLIVDNIDTIITTNTESPSKVVEEEKSDKDLGTTSNDLKQSDETIGDKVEQIATDVEKESSDIKDSDVVSSSCEEKQKAGQIKLDAEKKTSNIKESPKFECGIEEKPKVLPKKEIERLMVEEIGLNIESQLSISATSQDDRHCNVQQSNDVEPMDVDDVISEKSVEISNIKDLSIVETQAKDKGSKSIESSIRNSPKSSQNLVEVGNVLKETLHIVLAGDSRSVSNKQTDASGKRKADVKNKSDGEITDGGSSEIEAVDLQQEVVYISDDDKNEKMIKKKKKKDKKAKKEKKAKKSKSYFREDSDQNFFSDPKVSNKSVSAKNSENTVSDVNSKLSVLEQSKPIIIDEDDDICEVLELSDDSSCYEVEGVSLLSKEPTAEEIQALSSKIDEIDREEVVTDEQIREHENMLANKEQNESNIEDIENISWKDRYLSSRKVKMVLSTSSIFNAMRKKNKELKKKIEMSKKEAEKQLPEETPNSNDNINSNLLEEGSIEHFNALTGSTKYVNPVQENTANGDINETEQDANKDVSNEMKKDAKQLLKMYKRLLKYNDVNKQKDPNKKKKKKSKKSKDKSKDAANSISTEL